ncbi:MAG: hypothetical protein LUC24_06230 [Bacteroidales bacterium]|nr:hypothetical protein [Bacteroidales bacterium]
MKRIALAFAVAFFGLALFSAAAQDVADMDDEARAAASKAYSSKYDMLVSRLGLSGVGIETVLDNWEQVDPDNSKLVVARYAYYIDKAKTVSIVSKPGKRYLGNSPSLTLKDSLGNDVNYFEEVTYDDSLFSIALKYIDKAIRLNPKDLDYRFSRCNSLISYEGESPDMALAGVESLVDLFYADPKGWTFNYEDVDNEFFIAAIQEYCYTFYNMGTTVSYNAFKSLSEKMLDKEKDNTMFLSNLGTYYFIAAKDEKQAFKYYNKVLKLKPDDYTAAKNCVIIARHQKNTKLEKKYLPALIASTEDETEKRNAEARLKIL